MVGRLRFQFTVIAAIATCLCLLLLISMFKQNNSTGSRTEVRNEIFRNEKEDVKYETEIENEVVITDEQLMHDVHGLIKQTLKGNKIDPVVSMHIDKLKENGKIDKDISAEDIQSKSKKELHLRESKLTPVEKSKFKACVQTSEKVYKKEYHRFFGNKSMHPIRRTHHTYLTRDSILLEFGGNWGWDSGNFSELYGMHHVIFEPLKEYFGMLMDKFEDNPKTSIYNLGVGARNEKMMVALEGNNACSTSKFSKKTQVEGWKPIYIINAIDLFTYLGVGAYEVDLLAMNCEGCEYETLESLLKYNLIDKFRNIQWQTHPVIGISNPYERYCKIEQLLMRTHRPTYRFNFNWESWRRKDLP